MFFNSEKLVKKVYESKNGAKILRIFGFVTSFATVAVFSSMLVYYIGISFASVLKYLVALGAPYILVTLLRRLADVPRPYEVYDFFTQPPRDRSRDSFPSRHAFCIFAIGTLCIFVYPVVGILTLVMGVLVCISRVALGLHFVRDVIAGALVGIFTSLIGGFILI